MFKKNGKMEKEQLVYLYKNKNLSMTEIAKKLEVTHAKIYYWFEKFGIKRRGQKECAYVKQNPKGDPFKIKKNLTSEEKKLLVVGLMLYWAEGNKKNKFLVALGNLDSRMIKLFLEFLRKICRVDEKRLRLYVRVYKSFNKNKAHSYWESFLKLPKTQIYIYSHNDVRSDPRKQWSKSGIATLTVSNVKLKAWLDQAIEECLRQFAM